ncbi:hypothetical protein [Mucilaginibacter sp. UYCu711]|uniref:hypothetical protein n=1 Tax=Mucilaginibacter sp. UYCu711 TaxID=3156339 RepID=UPI003D1B91AC
MESKEIGIDEMTLKEMLEEIFKQEEKVLAFMKMQEAKLEEKDNTIAEMTKQTLTLVNSFESKYAKIEVKAPQPDLSGIKGEINTGLLTISRVIEKEPKPVVRQLRFTLFPEQVRSPEYYRIMLTRVIWGILGLVFLIICYTLISKHMDLSAKMR